MFLEFVQTPLGAAVVSVAGTILVGVFAFIWKLYTLAHINKTEIHAHKDECDIRGTEIRDRVTKTDDKIDRLHAKMDRLVDTQHQTHTTVVESVTHGKQQQKTVDRLVERVDDIYDNVTTLQSATETLGVAVEAISMQGVKKN